jgi:exopolysaccharide production protein ExoQ
MPPTLALLLWLVLLLALLYFDPAKDRKTPMALWVPVTWMFILASRLPSVWLGGSGTRLSAGPALEEGDPLDRNVFFGLMLIAIGILISRAFPWADFFKRNLALTLFLSFALVSFSWSDFPLIALKRWARDLGGYLVVLVVLSDSSPLDAVRTLLRRVSYALISLSIVLIKYYPSLAIAYEPWSGTATYAGATTSKNMLGIACLVSGLYFFWDTIVRWPERKRRRTNQIILLNVLFLAMTLWLLHMCNSATSRLSLVLGCLVIVAVHSKSLKRHPGFLKLMAPATFLVYVILAYGFGLAGSFASAAGRDPTLTGRTQIWDAVLSLHTNPLLGTGYETFWLGPRLEKVRQAAGEGAGLNEAHNGYLEAYLNLGMIGVSLLLGFVIAGYRNICKRLKPVSSFGSLTLSIWTAFLFHNLTEADFRSGVLWLMFSLASLATRGETKKRVTVVPGGFNGDRNHATEEAETNSPWKSFAAHSGQYENGWPQKTRRVMHSH